MLSYLPEKTRADVLREQIVIVVGARYSIYLCVVLPTSGIADVPGQAWTELLDPDGWGDLSHHSVLVAVEAVGVTQVRNPSTDSQRDAAVLHRRVEEV